MTVAIACCLLAAGVARITVSGYSSLYHDLIARVAERAQPDNPDLRRGRSAYERGDFVAAQEHLRLALTRLTEVGDRREAQTLLAASAFRSGNFRTTIATLNGRDHGREDCEHLLLLAAAYVEATEIEKGMALFATARERFPDDPGPLYWETHYQFLHGRVDAGRVMDVAELLQSSPSPKGWRLGQALQALVQPAAGPPDQRPKEAALLHAAAAQP